MQGSARGTAVVLVCVAVPWLALAVWRAHRGSSRALLLWAASLLFIIYNSVLFLFLTPFNAAFLVYVAMLGSALWALAYVAACRDLWRVGRRIARRAPVTGVAIYVWVVVGLNALAWLRVVVPALGGPFPAPMLAGTGVATSAIYVQDLAVWLPLAAVAAFWLRRRETRGAVVVAALLGLWVIEGLSIAVDQWFGSRADAASPAVSSALVVPFLVIAAVGSVPLVAMLRADREGSGSPAVRPPRVDHATPR
jgi:hypothetical protein